MRITLTKVGKHSLLRGTTTGLQVCEIRGYLGGDYEEHYVVDRTGW
jgi:hypothetical protein